MKVIELDPRQVITLNDFPLYSKRMFNNYMKKCEAGERLPYVPVIRKVVVAKYFDDDLLREFEEFRVSNPDAEYFMIDGTHRTTALTLSGCRISVVLYENDADIHEARKAMVTGQILDNGTLYLTLDENCEVLNEHFQKKPFFMTVKQKSREIEDWLSENHRRVNYGR
jgi:hypothetical protein